MCLPFVILGIVHKTNRFSKREEKCQARAMARMGDGLCGRRLALARVPAQPWSFHIAYIQQYQTLIIDRKDVVSSDYIQ